MPTKIIIPLTMSLAFVVLSIAGAVAQAVQDRQNFTYKRIVVGQAMPGKRITVQIDPVEQARLMASIPKPTPPLERQSPEDAAPLAPLVPLVDGAGGGDYAWYWEKVDPLRGKMAGRFAEALAALSQGPGGAQVSAPSLQSLQNLAQTYGKEILTATVGTQVSPALALAVMGVESGGRPDAISPKGAMGLMQLIPATAARFGVADAKNPAQNIKGGVAYLNWLMKEFDRDPLMVLAGYNAGEGAVAANGGVPPYAETRDYVPKVLAAWVVAQGLCATPPMLVSDPCVFNVIAASD
jgi:soluble lytic murein transglycosylase-like protein